MPTALPVIWEQFSIQPNGKAMNAAPRINWGHGRLLPYESIESITAKFCALNGRKPLQASRFLAEVAGISYWESAVTEIRHAPQIAISIAALLDEPVELVQTIVANSLDLPACFGTFKINWSGPSVNNVRFCPECIAQGFHSPFHTQPWFVRCLIHGTDLKTAYKGLYTAGSAFGKRVACLAHLYHEAGVLTKPPPPDPLPDGAFAHEVAVKVGAYAQWIAHLNQIRQAYLDSNVWISRGEDYLPGDAQYLLGRLNWISPIPSGVRAALGGVIDRTEPSIVEFSEKVTSVFLASTEQVSFDDFLWFYRKTHDYIDEEGGYRLQAKRAVEEFRMSHLHAQCKCRWGWNRNANSWSGLWHEVEPDGWPYWQLSCPYQVAYEQLEDAWINFRPAHTEWSRGITRQRYLIEYFDEVDKFVTKGFAVKSDKERPPEEPIKTSFNGLFDILTEVDYIYQDVRLQFPDDLAALIDKVLQAELLLDIAFYRRWLARIEQGASAAHSFGFPASVNLFYQGNAPHLKKDRLTLVVWPVPSV